MKPLFSRPARMGPVAFAVAAALATLAAGDRELQARIVPYFSPAPGSVRVFASVEPDQRNRRLRVEIDSPSFFHSTEIPLNGLRAARSHSVTFTDLPAGQYKIRIRVSRPSGELVTVKDFFVMSEPTS